MDERRRSRIRAVWRTAQFWAVLLFAAGVLCVALALLRGMGEKP